MPALHDLGQSLWLDYMRRQLLTSGELARLIREDGVRGVTSNPTIFEHAIGGSSDYDEALRALEQQQDRSASELYETLAVEDIQGAADALRAVYQASEQADGYASLEVSPALAHDTQATIAEARRLWKLLGRPNVMIKVPATPEGIPAIRQLLGEGINVNVTLMFARSSYEQVAEAYLGGLEAFRKQGGELRGLASVASIFVSRFDVLVDPMLESRAKDEPQERREQLLGLRGKVGIANAKRIYRAFRELCAGARFQRLAQAGARPQRILFASTSVKDPRMSDVLYVESLIGADTVDTVPPATLAAFKDHGRVRPTLDEHMDEAERVLAELDASGISLDAVTDRLLEEGVAKFAGSYDKLMAALERRRRGLLGALLDRTQVRAPSPIAGELDATLREWREQGKARRLWERDATLWTSKDEGRWLDWLQVADAELSDLDDLLAFARSVRERAPTHVAVLGMGGSSLFPDVLSQVFAPPRGAPRLVVLDSTDPDEVRAFEAGLELERTLFIVSSKSGSTLEPNLFADYFFGRLSARVGAQQAAASFIAITDPGSALERVARERGYARVLLGVPGIGGRYSALSPFGLGPAAAAQLDVRGFLERTLRMVHACGPCVPPELNPGVVLGTLLGVCAKHGRDKVTLVASPPLRPLGAWLEQLLAESTGKHGKGLIPVDGEPLGAPTVYGGDRVFAYLRLDGAVDAAQDAALEALAQAGHPVVQLQLGEAYDLGQELFRWEIATAVAGAILGLNPFDQPDVEASKVQARKLTDEYEQSGRLEPESYFLQQAPIDLFADEPNRARIERDLAGDRTLRGCLRAWIKQVKPGDYMGLLGWIARSAPHEERLAAMRSLLRDRLHVATCVGFGPRFLHSTGQAYKGGPASGVFLHMVGDNPEDLAVPGRKSTFGVVKQAQARGDFRVLAERGRRVLGVHLGADPAAGLDALLLALREALE